MKLPNLFDYATSELSQDAFILWLLQWANPEFAEPDQMLHDTAQNFVRLLLEDNDLEISSIKYDKQKFHIDVYAIVNNKYFILIEDKTNTSQHHQQMTIYSQEVERRKEYCNLQKHCVYFKTGNESQANIEAIRKSYETNNANWHFTAIQRQEFLSVLNEYDGENLILHNYRDRLGQLEADSLSYLNHPVNEWSWNAWQGFYTELAKYLPNIWWGIVPAKSGAFVCAAFPWVEIQEGYHLKLQIEGYHRDEELKKNRLCVKLEFTKGETNRLKQLKIYNKEMRALAAKKQLNLIKPQRFSTRGKVLTLACTRIDNIINGKFNIEAILLNLKQYEKLLIAFKDYFKNL